MQLTWLQEGSAGLHLSQGTVAGLQQGVVWRVDTVHPGSVVVEDEDRVITVGLLLGRDLLGPCKESNSHFTTTATADPRVSQGSSVAKHVCTIAWQQAFTTGADNRHGIADIFRATARVWHMLHRHTMPEVFKAYQSLWPDQ